MYPMKELEVVEETKHLVPNLAILAKALFGENSYLILITPHQSGWATQDIKIGDGLLWLLDSNQEVLSSTVEFNLTGQFYGKILVKTKKYLDFSNKLIILQISQYSNNESGYS